MVSELRAGDIFIGGLVGERKVKAVHRLDGGRVRLDLERGAHFEGAETAEVRAVLRR